MDKDTINIENDIIYNDFQKKVSEVLIRHKSILDILTKLEEYNARINRAVAKSVTSCGCISIAATKQNFNKETIKEVRDNMEDHVNGELCEICKEKLEEEIGAYLFYLAALCDTLDINLTDAMLNEYNNLKTLGLYNLK